MATKARAAGQVDGNKMRSGCLTDYNGSGLHLDYKGIIRPDGLLKATVNTWPSAGVLQAMPLTASADRSTTRQANVSTSGGIQYVLVCTFKTEGYKLHGPCALSQEPRLQAAGASDGSNVSVGYDAEFQGAPLHIVYTGSVQADASLKGKISTGDAAGAFTAHGQ